MKSKWTSFYATSLLPFQRRSSKAATKVRCQTFCVLSALVISIWDVLQGLISQVHKKMSSVLEMARWQRLMAKPDWTYRAFYQTGFLSAHAGGFTAGQNVTNLCLLLERNKHLRRITPGICTFSMWLANNKHAKNKQEMYEKHCWVK